MWPRELSPQSAGSLILYRWRFIFWHASCLEGREMLCSTGIMMLSGIWLILWCISSLRESSRIMHDDHQGQRLRSGFSLRTVFTDTRLYRLCRDLIGRKIMWTVQVRVTTCCTFLPFIAMGSAAGSSTGDHRSLMPRSFNPNKSPGGEAPCHLTSLHLTSLFDGLQFLSFLLSYSCFPASSAKSLVALWRLSPHTSMLESNCGFNVLVKPLQHISTG